MRNHLPRRPRHRSIRHSYRHQDTDSCNCVHLVALPPCTIFTLYLSSQAGSAFQIAPVNYHLWMLPIFRQLVRGDEPIRTFCQTGLPRSVCNVGVQHYCISLYSLFLYYIQSYQNILSHELGKAIS